MGMVYTFKRISPADAARISADPELAWDLLEAHRRTDDEPCGDLDKAWDGLQYLLAKTEVGIDLLREDRGRPDDETCTVVWTVEEVAGAARTLAATPFEVLAEHFDLAALDEEGIYPDIWDTDWCADYVREHYAGLREFFAHAAATESAAVARFE
ncbi:YfbM family protein [Nocardia sp. NPDC059177]|uniref:YfbM family protein n=1 Tax=Nocardia sp. NPDC059177 TaxID=3346759 RepID=UPI0036BB960D